MGSGVMKIDIEIEEEITIGWDSGKKDVIIMLSEATDTDYESSFRIYLNMNIDILRQLQKEINEFLKGE